MESVLRFPRDTLHRLTERGLAFAQGAAHRRPVAVGPPRLHDDAPKMGVAGLGDAAAPSPRAARVLAGAQAAIAHQLGGSREAGELPDFGDNRDRRYQRNPA